MSWLLRPTQIRCLSANPKKGLEFGGCLDIVCSDHLRDWEDEL